MPANWDHNNYRVRSDYENKLIIARFQKYLFLPWRYLYSFLKDYSLERSILFSGEHLKETWHYIVVVVACKNLKLKQVAGAVPL